MHRLTVRKILADLPALRGAKVVGGAGGLSRIVKGATVMEVPDISRWLQGGELVLTSLYALRSDPGAQVRLVEELVGVGAAGLLVKTRFVGELAAEMLQEANRLALPLIEIPDDTFYNDILNGVVAEVLTQNTLQRYAADLVEDLIRGALPSLEAIIARAERVGWDAAHAAAAAIVQIDTTPPQDDSTEVLEELQRSWDATVDYVMAATRRHRCLVGTSGRFVHLIFACPDDAPEERASIKRLLEDLLKDVQSQRPHQQLSIGLGELAETVLDIPRSFKEASQALEISRRLWGPGYVADINDLGVYSLLIDWLKRKEGPINPISNRGLQRLLAYDRQHNGPLVQTLRRYLDLQGNMRRTAAELFVHYKTVRYRIQRIHELTGWDLSRPELRLEVELQLRMLELLDR